MADNEIQDQDQDTAPEPDGADEKADSQELPAEGADGKETD